MVPPVAVSVWEYAVPTVPLVKELVEILGGVLMTCPLTMFTVNEFPLMSPTITLERVRGQVPLTVLAVIVMTAKVPATDTVCPGVVIAPATLVKVPAVLLIVPAVK